MAIALAGLAVLVAGAVWRLWALDRAIVRFEIIQVSMCSGEDLFGETMRKVAHATEDAVEGRNAARERRQPEWRGR